MSKLCPHCNSVIADYEGVCPYCGNCTSQPYQQGYYMPPQQYINYAAPVPVRRGTPGKGIGIASMILGIVGIVFCAFVLLFMMIAYVSVNPFAALSAGLIFLLVGAPAVLLSFIFAIAGLAQGYRRHAVAGFVLSFVCIVIIVVYFIMMADVMPY